MKDDKKSESGIENASDRLVVVQKKSTWSEPPDGERGRASVACGEDSVARTC